MGVSTDAPPNYYQEEAQEELPSYFNAKGKTYEAGDILETRIVHLLDFEFFRQRLVEHFTIMFNKYQVAWPIRNK